MTPIYVFTYKLYFSGILPFIALVVVNSMIYKILKRRSALRSHMTNHTSNQLKDVAANQAHIFFVICVVFTICHALRVGLGIHDIFLVETYRGIQENCSDIKFSSLVAGSVSNILLTSNSSLNFVIYALMSREFRQLLLKKAKVLQFWCKKNLEEKEDVELAETAGVNDQKQEFSEIKAKQISLCDNSNDQTKSLKDTVESYV